MKAPQLPAEFTESVLSSVRPSVFFSRCREAAKTNLILDASDPVQVGRIERQTHILGVSLTPEANSGFPNSCTHCFWTAGRKPEYLDRGPTRTQGDRVNITLRDRTRKLCYFGGGGANYGTTSSVVFPGEVGIP